MGNTSSLCGEERGWFSVLDKVGRCGWEKWNTVPAFLYSKRNTAVEWTSEYKRLKAVMLVTHSK